MNKPALKHLEENNFTGTWRPIKMMQEIVSDYTTS